MIICSVKPRLELSICIYGSVVIGTLLKLMLVRIYLFEDKHWKASSKVHNKLQRKDRFYLVYLISLYSSLDKSS